MLGAEMRQVYHDATTAKELVKEYIPEEAHKPALLMARQVNGVSTYLSQIATGEVRHVEGLYFAVGIAGMDVMTDYYNRRVSDGLVYDALTGDDTEGPMGALHKAEKLAYSENFHEPILDLAEYQDQSLVQFDDAGRTELRRITERKGGASGIAHLHALKGDISLKETSVMQEFGFTMQLLDDHLDKAKDEREGIKTLFTEGHYDTDALRARTQELSERLEKVFGPSSALDRFGKVMSMHIRLGRLEQRVPGTASRLLPWYF